MAAAMAASSSSRPFVGYPAAADGVDRAPPFADVEGKKQKHGGDYMVRTSGVSSTKDDGDITASRTIEQMLLVCRLCGWRGQGRVTRR